MATIGRCRWLAGLVGLPGLVGLALIGAGGCKPPATQPGQIQLGAATLSIGEAGGTVRLTLVRAGGSEGAVSVQVASVDGEAKATADYVAVAQVVTFPAGDVAPRTIDVAIVNDALLEGSEGFQVVLSAPTGGATLGTPDRSTITILDDDNLATNPVVVEIDIYAGDMGGPGNADGAGAYARFNFPRAIAGGLLAEGALRWVSTDGLVATASSSAAQASGLAVDPTGGWVVAQATLNQVSHFDGTKLVPLAGGGPGGTDDGKGFAARFRGPTAVAVDDDGIAYVTDTGNHTIRRVTPDGTVVTLAGQPGVFGVLDGRGAAAQFHSPASIARDPSTGVLYVGDGLGRLRSVAVNGDVETVAGSLPGAADSTDPLKAQFRSIDGLAIDGQSGVYIADGQGCAIRHFAAPHGGVSTVAGQLGLCGSIDGPNDRSRFNVPLGLSLMNGDILVADSNNFTLRFISRDGGVKTVAGAPSITGYADGARQDALFWRPRGVAAGAVDGTIYLTDDLASTIRVVTRGKGDVQVGTFAGLYPESGIKDGPAGEARFDHPSAVSALGTWVADTGNATLRHIDAAGIVTTVAGTLGTPGIKDGIGQEAGFRGPYALWESPAGTVYIADGYAIRTYDPTTRRVATLAGSKFPGYADGRGEAARFVFAEGICGDGAGNLYVADSGDPASAIRKVTPDGTVTTLNASGGGYLDGPLASALLRTPTDVACTTDGTLYVADHDNAVLRRFTPAGEASTILGTKDLIGYSPGTTPSVLGKPYKLALQGHHLYLTVHQGVLDLTLF